MYAARMDVYIDDIYQRSFQTIPKTPSGLFRSIILNGRHILFNRDGFPLIQEYYGPLEIKIDALSLASCQTESP